MIKLRRYIVFKELIHEAKSSSKTKDLLYEKFVGQKYLTVMDAFSARRIA